MFLQVRMQAPRSIGELFGTVAWDRTLSAGVIIRMDARSNQFVCLSHACRLAAFCGGSTHCESNLAMEFAAKRVPWCVPLRLSNAANYLFDATRVKDFAISVVACLYTELPPLILDLSVFKYSAK